MCVIAVASAAFAFAAVADSSLPRSQLGPVIVITLACFTTGLVSGTIAVAVSHPKAGSG